MGTSITPSLLPIALRANVVRAERQDRERTKPRSLGWPETVLILDTECTVDPSQRLTFGSYWLARFEPDGRLTCVEEGLFHGDALKERDPKGYARLRKYRTSHPPATQNPHRPRLRLYARRDFVNTVLWNAIQAGSLIVGYNLAFDLARLAIYATEARGLMFEGGFSLSLFDYYDKAHEQYRINKFRPWLRFKTIDGKRALLGLAHRRGAPEDERKQAYEALGRLLDVQHLVFALTDRKLSLKNAAEAFGLSTGKLDPGSHGIITPAYIDYNRRDVEVTARLLESVRVEFDRHPVALSPDRVLSPAGLGKGYLRAMGITPPAQKFAIAPDMLGRWMTTYFGGRTEVRIRRTPVPVVYLDFLAMYPTVNSLMGLWDLLIADKLDFEEATGSVRTFFEQLTMDQCFRPALWPSLRFIALVRPQGDVLPVRAPYNEHTDDFAIGVNPLTSEEPLWVAGPDLVASWLLTGRRPEVLEAVRIVPTGQQPDLTPTSLRGQVPIDPRKEDFFRRVIELRKGAPQRRDLTESDRTRLNRFLKVLSNSASYGIYAELNRQPVLGKDEEDVTVYGRDGGFPARTGAPEEPGEFCFLPFATLTTAGARLMLALLERAVLDQGGVIAFGDTDSAAVVATAKGGLIPCPGGPIRAQNGTETVRALSWSQVQAVVRRFRPLNPYQRKVVPGSILKVEDVNYIAGDPSKRQRQLHAYAISAKRYALFTRSRRGTLTIVDAKEHGLGHLLNPIDQDAESRDWIAEVWAALVGEALTGTLHLPNWVKRPAITRLAVSSPTIWRTYDKWNEGKPYDDQIKPTNFGISLIVAPLGLPAGVQPGDPFHLLGPYERDAAKWLTMLFYDRYSQRSYRVGVGRSTPGTRAQVQTIRNVIEAYRVHPEPKSLDASGSPCDRRSVGLLQRRPVELEEVIYLGKEANGLEEVERRLIHRVNEVQTRYVQPVQTRWDRAFRVGARCIGAKRLAVAVGVSSRSIWHYLSGKHQPSPDTYQLLRRELARWARRAVRLKGLGPAERAAARQVIALEQTGRLLARPRNRKKGGKR